jgi:hypothetical protein
MPHSRIIIDKDGNIISGGHRTADGEIVFDHAPESITFENPSDELAEALAKFVNKFFKNEDKK